MKTLLRKKVLTFALVFMTILALVIAIGNRHIATAKALGGGAACVSSPSSIQSNFNGTSIPAGDVIWFTSVLKVKGLPKNSTATVQVESQTIQFAANSQTYSFAAPFGQVTFDPNATSATTSFSFGNWATTVPFKSSGNTFLTGSAFVVPAGGLPGGINPVTWSGTLLSTASVPLTVHWQWAAAVYTNFNATNYNALGVKAVDDNHFPPYQNSDLAGTPENYKSSVTGGAGGGGGANYTGELSATASVQCSANTATTSPIGAWFVNAVGAPFQPHVAIFHSDGTMIIDNPEAGDPNTSDSFGMGPWQLNQSNGTVSGKFEEVNASRTTNAFVSTLIVTFTITVSGNTFTGPAQATYYNPDGSLQAGPFPATLNGTLIQLP